MAFASVASPAYPAAAEPSALRDRPSYRIVPSRYLARTVGTVLSLAVIAAILNSVLGNPRWGWPVFAEWFFSEPVLAGLGRTLLLTAVGATFGFLLGAGLALARVSGSPLLAALSWGYVWLFRSIPLIVLLLLLNNLGHLYETITLGVPFTEISLFSYQTTHLLTPFAAAVVFMEAGRILETGTPAGIFGAPGTPAPKSSCQRSFEPT